MKKYTNGTKTITATERAFEVLYKEQGFKEVEATPKATNTPKKQTKDKAQEG